MRDGPAGTPSHEELATLVAAQAQTIKAQAEQIERLKARVGELERLLGQNSGNSGKPLSRDPAAERQRQAEQRAKRASGTKRGRGKQPGAKGRTLEMSDRPDVIIDHVPDRCEGCGAALEETSDRGVTARQVVDVPEIRPTVTERRAHTYGCGCVGTRPLPVSPMRRALLSATGRG